ncbi:MAG TPA: hypothetical protein VM262_00445 [Acidimicrobiales bacterium]|nr:hypothetical protein [Acidimicrobiales bacterium]
MTTALVAGAVANKPGNGGAAWTRLSWAVGLARLGFDVHVVEQLAPGADAHAEDWFAEVMGDFGLTCRSTLLRADGSTAAGLPHAQLVDLAASAALLLNISGHLTDPKLTEGPATTVFVDLDPGYTQLWHADGTAPLERHDHWYTVGALIGTKGCAIPTDGIAWRPTLQPVVLDDWPVQPPVPCDRFTTVASWRGAYGPVAFGGDTLGTKAHEFRRFLDLPRRVEADLELCLEIHPGDDADRTALERNGWHLVEPAATAGSPHAFRAYVQSSPAELSVAQAVYVHPRTGWFSDRSVRYLASGRPVLVQDTGFSEVLPVGEGLLAFDDDDAAVAGARAIAADVDRHARAARALAAEWFDAKRVLGRLCEEVGVAP